MTTDVEFEIGATYRINPVMKMGLPVFLGKFHGLTMINSPSGTPWQVCQFELLTKILGFDCKFVVLKPDEIQSAVLDLQVAE